MSSDVLFITADESQNGMRIDKLISLCGNDISRSMAVKLIEKGQVTVNGKPVNKSCVITEGDEITAVIPEPEVLEVKAENIPLEIVYEDDYLLVVNKPKGMVVHPAAGNYTGTLVSLRRQAFFHKRSYPSGNSPPHRQEHQRSAHSRKD